MWKCQCSCGNIVTVRAGDLQSGRVKSCGHLLSSGEANIKSIFDENNIIVNSQYTFDDLLGPNGGKMRFDFGVLNANQELQYLVEYDGIQHFKEVNIFDSLEEVQYRDRFKNAYCLDHNIPLIRLPAIDPSTITIDDLSLSTTQYLVTSVDQYQDQDLDKVTA